MINEYSIEAKRSFVDNVLNELSPYINGRALTELNRKLMTELDTVELVAKTEPEWIDYETENRRILEMYISTKTVEGLSKGSINTYVRELNKFFDFIKESYTNITTQMVRDYFQFTKETSEVSNTYLDHIRRCLSSFFNWLQVEGHITKNPMSRIKKIKGEQKIRKPFSSYDLNKLRQNCETPRDTAVIEFLYSTGLRASEVCSVKISDIDWYDKTFYVTGKGNKERKVYFNDKCKLALEEYIKTRKQKSEYIICGQKCYDGEYQLTVHGLRLIIHKIAERADMKEVYPHRFRHTFATDLLNKGMPIEQVKELMGHESIDTTLIYGKINDKAVKHAHKKYTN